MLCIMQNQHILYFIFLVQFPIIRTQQFILIVHNAGIVASPGGKRRSRRIRSLIRSSPPAATAETHIPARTAPQTRRQQRQGLRDGNDARDDGDGHGDERRVSRKRKDPLRAAARPDILPESDLSEFAVPSRVDVVPCGAGNADGNDNGEEYHPAADAVFLLVLLFLVGARVRGLLIEEPTAFARRQRNASVARHLPVLDRVRVFAAVRHVIRFRKAGDEPAAAVALRFEVVVTV